MRNYLIDIDGTITEDVPNEQPERMPLVEPYPGAVARVNALYDAGDSVTFFTSRTEEMRAITAEWLNRWGFRYHGLLMNKPRGGRYVWVDNLDVKYVKAEYDPESSRMSSW